MSLAGTLYTPSRRFEIFGDDGHRVAHGEMECEIVAAQAILGMMVEAPRLVAVLESTLEHIEGLLAQMVTEQGGGAQGLVNAQAAAPEWYERRDMIISALTDAGWRRA
jgi:hypothetical protein